MSVQFSDTSNLKGLVQIYEKECGYSYGDISGNTSRLKSFTADVNLALDDFTTRALKASGVWQFDDSNHTDYPFITTTINSGQRDYPFTTDENGNLILQIYKVMVADSSGYFREIYPVDQETPNNDNENVDSFINGQNATGTPTRYDLTANGIFLDLIPNYTREGALKVFINREASYFTYTDTTKKPGVPGNLHKYFALKPALDYSRRNGLKNYNALSIEVTKLERDIDEYFGMRDRQTPKRLIANRQNNK